MTDVTIPAGTTMTINVAGTFETHPLFLLGAGVLDLSNGGHRMFTTSSVPDAAVLDMHEHTLLSGSTNEYAKIAPTSMWWALQPGSNTIVNNGTADAVMTYFAAWI